MDSEYMWVTPHPLGQRIKDSPEDFLGEQKFILRCCAVAAPARHEAVVLPVLFIVVSEQLWDTEGGEGRDTVSDKYKVHKSK